MPASGTAPAPAREALPFGWRFTSPLMLGSSLNPINSSMIATALVGIGADLHVAPGATATLISVLYLCSAIAQPTLGKVATVIGPRRTFLGGLVLLVVAGLVGVLAPSFLFVVVSRGLIGIGTSACYPSAMAMVRRRADEAGMGTPGRVIGSLSIAAQVTATFGLPLGGVLVGVLGWRAIFAINVPLAIIAIVLTLIGLPRDDVRRTEGARGIVRALDVPGIALFAATVTALLLFLGDLAHPSWPLAAAAVVLGVVLVLRERRVASPLLDVRMLAANGALVRTYARQLLTALTNYACLLGFSQWMEQARGLSATHVGLLLIPLTLLSAIVARIVSTRGWVRLPLIVAGAVLAASGVLLLAITTRTPIPLLLAFTLLLGLVNGLNGFGNQAALYVQAPAEQIGVASGLLRTAMYLGAIFSSSLIGIAFGNRASDGGLHVLAVAFLAAGVVNALLASLDRRIQWRA